MLLFRLRGNHDASQIRGRTSIDRQPVYWDNILLQRRILPRPGLAWLCCGAAILIRLSQLVKL